MNRTITIKVGLGSCGIAAGAAKVYDFLDQSISNQDLEVQLEKTSCIGMCYREPLVEIVDQNGSYLYGEVDEKKAARLLREHVLEMQPVTEWLVSTPDGNGTETEFLQGQVKIALRNCGRINPENIQHYLDRGGYQALQKIGSEGLSPENVLDEVLASGIRGRGGGGFPTGVKWKFARNFASDQKYLICNADEGDPGAFMDRSILEGDPHAILEGMMIGGYVIGASKGIIYCRAEYPLAIKRLNLAIDQARENGFLGKNPAGIPDFQFDISIKEGAGAFVCGEETALIASVEGKRGMPRKRPPFPAESGLWEKPTNINNVETLANIPWILQNGGKQYAAYGTEKSKGTKVFALTGKIKRGGLVEVPMGITVNEIIFKLGGGIQDDRKFKAVQLGGPSGGCIPAQLGETIVDYDSVNATGAIMGSGGMVVMDETTCMVDMARFFLEFTQKESCGKCTFCRIGTKRMLEILTRITEGEGVTEDLDELEELAYQIKDSSLCGLGQTAPNPVLTTLKYFRDEYEAHIHHKKCPAKSCKTLLTYEIIEEICNGCGVCARNCSVDAIVGEKKKTHFIVEEDCIKCGICFAKCRFDAVRVS
jgi:NADH-quinone oxidoreductase subunit F